MRQLVKLLQRERFAMKKSKTTIASALLITTISVIAVIAILNIISQMIKARAEEQERLFLEEKQNNEKYEYISSHLDCQNETTYAYLNELISIDYKDCQTIYSDLYSWKVSLLSCNTSEDDYETIQDSVSRYCSYLHFVFLISGGTPGETITMTHKTVYPNGEERWAEWNWEEKRNGDSFGCDWDNGIYNNPEKGETGSLTITIYSQPENQQLGTFSVSISKEDDGSRPTKLSSLEIIDEEGHSFFPIDIEAPDGSTHRDFHTFSSAHSMWRDTFEGFCSVQLDKNYSVFSGTYFCRKEMTNASTISFFIYLDDKCIYKDEHCALGDGVHTFSVNVTSGKTIKIVAITDDDSYRSETGVVPPTIILTDAFLTS